MSARAARLRALAGRLDLRRTVTNAVTALGFFGGIALVVAGVALVSLAAGLIVGGLALTTVAALYARAAE